MIDIDKNFPAGHKPYPHQVDILERINTALFKDDHKYIVIAAPTGTGKSFIAKTISNASNPPTEEYKDLITSYDAFKIQAGEYTHAEDCISEQPFGALTLTTTKSLQDQYMEMFKDLECLKGKSNYACAYDDQFTCDVAPCIHTPTIKRGCIAEKMCPYINRRSDTLCGQSATLNYSMFLSLPDHLKYRDYIICDEASELESTIVGRFTSVINIKQMKSFNVVMVPAPKNDYGKLGIWLVGIVNDLHAEADDIRKQLAENKSPKSLKYKSLMGRLTSISNIIMKLDATVETWRDSDYIMEFEDGEYTFKPLKVNRLAQYIFKYGTKIVLMSATIIDHDEFCKSLGIDRHAYIEVDSPFDPKHAPILTSRKVRLNYKSMKTGLPVIADMVKQICNKHKDDKGIIHTHSNSITSTMKRSLSGNRFIFRERGVNNEQILNQHINTTDPTVIVSPSMNFGVDLKGDLARFQIIIKAPFMPMSDKRIKALIKDNYQWYINHMLCNVIQSCGRGIRSKDDYCITYILDGTIVDNIMRNKQRLPKYFINRFV